MNNQLIILINNGEKQTDRFGETWKEDGSLQMNEIESNSIHRKNYSYGFNLLVIKAMKPMIPDSDGLERILLPFFPLLPFLSSRTWGWEKEIGSKKTSLYRWNPYDRAPMKN